MPVFSTLVCSFQRQIRRPTKQAMEKVRNHARPGLSKGRYARQRLSQHQGQGRKYNTKATLGESFGEVNLKEHRPSIPSRKTSRKIETESEKVWLWGGTPPSLYSLKFLLDRFR